MTLVATAPVASTITTVVTSAQPGHVRPNQPLAQPARQPIREAEDPDDGDHAHDERHSDDETSDETPPKPRRTSKRRTCHALFALACGGAAAWLGGFRLRMIAMAAAMNTVEYVPVTTPTSIVNANPRSTSPPKR